MDPTIDIPSSGAIAFTEPNANSSNTHPLHLSLGNGNQAPRSDCVEGRKLENTDAIDIYSSPKHISGIQEDHSQGDGAV